MSTTPRQIPQTPPASSRKSNSTKMVPKFQLPDMTPESHVGSKPSALAQLRTPATAKGQGKTVSIFSPDKPDFTVRRGSALFPPSPEKTPHRSPRNKRKKLSFESILPSSDSISLLLPNHGTVGSGRRHLDAPALQKPMGWLDSAEIFKINRDLNFEEEDSETDSPTEAKGGRKATAYGADLSLTPGKQLITEEKVNSWHGNPWKGSFSSDEDSDEDMQAPFPGKLSNPFVSTGSSMKLEDSPFNPPQKINPFSSAKNEVNYATHMEKINHRTGERKIELLSEEQQRFKPKKLDFSKV